LLLLVTLIWGGTFVMVKGAVATFPVFPFLTLRFGLATCALLIIGWRRLSKLSWRGVGAGILIGLFLYAGYAFQTMGLRYTSASTAGFITGLSVVIVPILSALLLRRLPALKAVIGVLLATVGLALLTLSGGFSTARGDLLVLCCALSFAAHVVSVSAFAPKSDPLALTIVQVATVAVISGISSLFTARPWPAPTSLTWLAAAFTGILATALAFAIQTTVQRFTTPTRTALIFTAEPVFAALFAVLLTHDTMTAWGVAGGALIILGTIISELRWSKKMATIISRFLAPNYTSALLLLVMALADPASRKRGLLWGAALSLLVIAIPVFVFRRELRKGGISDWHVSDRRERLRLVPVLVPILGTAVPLLLIILFDGPRSFFVAFLAAFYLAFLELLITIRWKISGHVSTVALSAIFVTAFLGAWASPTLLLIPLTAWARVKIGAHTVMQTVAGGAAGIAISFLTLRLCGVV